jgi:cell division transport system ATP-binding protein
MQLFKDLHQVGVSLLIASHDLGLISRIGGRLLSLDQGRLVEDKS